MDKKAWTEKQNLAIERKIGNILVSASAGSGKTAVLVERIINKIINENINIDNLLIVTFTNAAASEMRERILEAIYTKLDEEPENAHLANQIMNMSKAKITTIDAFCMDVVKSNFYLTDIDPNFSICNEIDGYTMRLKAINEVLEEEYSKEDNTLLQDYIDLFGEMDDTKLIDTILRIYRYIQSFPYPFDSLNEMVAKYNVDTKITDKTGYINVVLSIVKEEIEGLIEQLTSTIEKLEYDEELEKYLEALREDKQKYELCTQNIMSFDKVQTILNSDDFFVRLTGKRSISNIEGKEEIQKVRGYVKDKHKELCKYMYSDLNTIVNDIRDTYKYLEYLNDIIIRLDEKYTQFKRKKNMMDFSDISHLALNILVDKKIINEKTVYVDTEVASRYKEKFKEIYIDEYQDSNFLQEALLLAISRKSLNEPNEFMVGDIKQSIYRFRQAMPELFEEKYEQYSDNKEEDYLKIVLSKNFRSRKNILDSINYIFTKIMSKKVGECTYKGEECLSLGANYENYNRNDYATEINIMDVNKELEDESSEEDKNEKQDADENEEDCIIQLNKLEIEAKEIALRIKELVDGKEGVEPFKIYDLKKKEFRNIKYKDIVILARSLKNKANVIESNLKAMGIPVFCDFNEAFFDSNEVKLVTSFLEVIDNRYQDLPLIAIMYSIIGGFTLDELVKIRSYKKNEYIYNSLLEASKEEKGVLKEKIELFLKLLERFSKYSKECSIKELLWKLYNETNVYIQFKCMENGKQMCANLDGLIDIAGTFESTGNTGLYRYIAYINEAKDRADKSMSAKIIGENEDVVRIMSIHKSKGLEFPVVILACSASKFNMADLKSEILMHHRFGLGMSVIKKHNDYMITYPSVVKNLIKSVIKKETISEELRLLYVALTRAKEKLIIYSTVNNFDNYYKNKYILQEKDKDIIKPMSVLNIKSYFDAIMYVLKDYNEDVKEVNFKINILAKSIFVVNEPEVENKTTILDSFEKYVKGVSDKTIKEDVKKEIIERINYKYPYILATTIQNKYSVSEIKKIVNNNIFDDENNVMLNQNTVIEKIKSPSFLKGNNEKISSAYKGTLIHLVLENMDYSKIETKEDIEKTINLLVENGKISLDDRKLIDEKIILDLVNSNIGKRLKQAKQINKETKFVIKKRLKDIKELNINLDEEILLQGIIDLYFVDKDGRIILIDFKTDNIESEEQFIKKYKIQLDIYKEAIEKCLNKRVDETYIYSFKLNKAIEI